MGAVDINFNNRKSRESLQGISLVLYPDSLVYGVWNKSDALIKVEHLDREESLIHQVKDIISSHNDAELKISAASIPFLHIPEELYEKDNASGFFEDIYPERLLEDQSYNNDILIQQKINTSYFVPSSLGRRLIKNTQHFSTVLSECFSSEDMLLAFIDGKNLILFYIKDELLQFYNHYQCHHPEDYLYYILLAYDEFKLSTSDYPLKVTGRIDRDSNVLKLLSQYVGFDFLKFDKDQFRSGDLPQHYYHDLYLCWICE